jgi:hypothetical protein
VPPAQQGLTADNPPGPGIHDRLILELELPPVQGLAQRLLEHEELLLTGVHLALEDAVGAAAIRLCPV